MMHAQPDILSYVSRHLIAPLWAAKERSPYLRLLQTLTRTPFRALEDIEGDQLERLKKLLLHAAGCSPYYDRILRESDVSVEDVHSLKDLEAIPVLTKDCIRDNQDALFATGLGKENLVRMKTSGSTGVSLELYMDEGSQQWKRACALRHNEWSGWRFGERCGAIWGNPEYTLNWRTRLRNILLDRMFFLDTLKMDKAAMLKFHEEMVLYKPTLVFGHAHSLYLFAQFLLQEGLACPSPKGLISTAMVLHDFEREVIEKAFKAKVFNRYGCEEVSLIASECHAHEGLHVNMDTLIVEIVRPDGTNAAPGEPGAVVVTDLTNYAMPVIRYKVGDVATKKDAPCSCGMNYPLLESLNGRIADYVRTPSGKFISGISLTENFAMKLPGIRQLQIVQDKLDHFIYRVVKGEAWSEQTANEIGRLTDERFDGEIRHEIEFVESIQSEASGKYRFCISLLDEQPF